MSKVHLRIDNVDLQILKILTQNCRTSYRSIGKTLGINVNTVRTRINNLRLNKIIEQFITIVNFSLFGYTEVVTILLKASKKSHNFVNKISTSLRDWGPIYMHIEVFDGIHVIAITVKNKDINSNNIVLLKKNVSNALGRSDSVVDIFYGRITSLVSEKFHLRKVDFQILECLLSDPRMTFLTIARTLGYSQKTIIRRIERLENSRVIMGYSLQYNPSYMKGYNYFTVLIQIKSGMTTEVTKEITFSELSEYILRFPLFTFRDRIIIIFSIENIFDIESIVSKIRSMKGVVKAEAYQPIKIKWHEDWLKKEIANRIIST